MNPIREGERVHEEKYYNERKSKSIQRPLLDLCWPKTNKYSLITLSYQLLISYRSCLIKFGDFYYLKP